MKINENKQYWIVGVSGGSDSMALLHNCIQQQIPVIVAHMNYKKRASADRDMEGVIRFCKQYNIPVEVRILDKVCSSNFQDFARKERYLFFKELLIQYQAKGILIAHQEDDLLETYWMQKERNALVDYYGIKEETILFDCLIKRPLLNKSKAQLVTYCQQHKIDYYEDESNQSDQYKRNYIRHHCIEKLSNSQRKALLDEIAYKNKELQNMKIKAQQFLQNWEFDKESLLALSYRMCCYVMQDWIKTKCQKQISQKEASTIYELLKQDKNWERDINASYLLCESYGVLHILKKEIEYYNYEYENLWYGKQRYFSCFADGMKKDGVYVKKEDFPITIRNARNEDKIKLSYGTKKINRWFIDHKIPMKERKIWPVVVNSQGKIIFVPKIGCDIEHFSNNMNLFVIK